MIAKLWNSLGKSFKDVPTLDNFKSFMLVYDVNDI